MKLSKETLLKKQIHTCICIKHPFSANQKNYIIMKGEDIVDILKAVLCALCVLIIWYIKTIVSETIVLWKANKTSGVIVDACVLMLFVMALIVALSALWSLVIYNF